MPNRCIRGTHHLTFCVGGAQEDYDFHVRLLGLRSVKKTVLFDGEIPIYHLYYANRIGDLARSSRRSRIARRDGWAGAGPTSSGPSGVSVPADSIGYWADRLRAAGVEVDETERFGTQRLDFAHPCGIPYSIVGETEQDDREPWDGGDVPLEHAIRGAHGTTTSVREPEPMDDFLRRGIRAAERPRHRRPAPPVPDRRRRWRRPPDRARGGARPRRRARGPSARGRSTTTPSTRGTLENQAAVKDWHRRPRLHRRLRRQGPRLLPLGLHAHARRRAVRVRRLDVGRASPSTSPRTSSARTCASRRTGRTGAARSISWSRSTRSSRSSEPAPRSSAGPGREGARPGAAGRRGPARPRPGAGLHARAPRRSSIDDPDVAYVLPAASGGSWYPGRFHEPRIANEPQLGQALEAAETAIAEVLAAGVPPERVVLAGFSQGGCLVAELIARAPRPYAGAALLTGALIGPADEMARPGPLDGLPVFMETAASTSGCRWSEWRRRRGRWRRRARASSCRCPTTASTASATRRWRACGRCCASRGRSGWRARGRAGADARRSRA